MSVPLGCSSAITGASGSGKSTLINDIALQGAVEAAPRQPDAAGRARRHRRARARARRGRASTRSPIGRNAASNPATYIGFYDTIRELFAERDAGEGARLHAGTLQLQRQGRPLRGVPGRRRRSRRSSTFMPDVEVTCADVQGRALQQETLEVTYRGKTIADVLDLSIEEGVGFFAIGAGDRAQDRRPQRARPRLPHARPVVDDALGRRSAARQARGRARQAQARQAQALHPRRADDRPALRRHRAAAGVS